VSFNQCVFVGNAGQEPEIRTTTEGVNVARFRLAVETDFKKDSQEPPMWLTIVAWRNLAGQVEKVVKKGSLVLVSGRLSVRAYTDKAETKRTSVEVIAQSIQVLPSKAKAVEMPEQEKVEQTEEAAA